MCICAGLRVTAGHVVRAGRGGVGQGQLAAAGDRVAAGAHTERGALLQRGGL